MNRAYASADALFRKPTAGIAACCARAASGHATDAPPTNAMNSRRFIALTKPKDHGEYSRSRPCIAAKAACSCPLWVKRNRGWQRQRPIHVRFAPKAAVEPSHCNPPLCAKSGCEQSQQELYSITWSAMASRCGGAERPSVRAVCTLMTSLELG
jgi:hypothetical protein